MKRSIVVVACLTLLLAACSTSQAPSGATPTDNENAVVTASEGETVELEPTAVDPDNDTVTYTYSAPFNDDGTWNTTQGDAGEYNVTITASDGSATVTQTVVVRVQGKNAPPVLRCRNITVTEGKRFRIPCNASDPDNEEVVLAYDGLNDRSWYASGYDEAGTYRVNVSAMDKHYTVKDHLYVTITDKNRPPVLEVGDVTGGVGETMRANVTASDPDGDDLTITYQEPFTDGTWTPGQGDVGDHTVTVIATDGDLSVEKDFTATVRSDTGRPSGPNVTVQDVYVEEGETIRLPVNASGEDLTMLIEGWLSTKTYTTSYEDAYPDGCPQKGCTARYSVNVTVSDARSSTERTIDIYVEDVNRPPVFKRPY